MLSLLCCNKWYGIQKDEKNGVDNFESFTEIFALKDIKIKDDFAGFNHSLFLTEDGKVLACWNNDNGQLNIMLYRLRFI